jgi:protein-disulfide isomerase
MKSGKVLVWLCLAVCLSCSIVFAQRPRPQRKSAKPAPAPAKTTTATQPAAGTAQPKPSQPVAAATPVAPGTLATVNGESITLEGLASAELTKAVNGIDDQIKSMRTQGLEEMIGRILLESEAKKIGISVDQLVDQQVRSKVNGPTEEEISAFYNANKQQIGSADLQSVKPQITEYLRNEKTQKAGNEYISKLRGLNKVTVGADPNAVGLKPETVLATVNGQSITADELNERLKPFVYKLRQTVFEAEMQAVNVAINDKLLTADAKKKNVSPEEYSRTEIVSKLTTPTDAEIDKFYNENKDRISSDLATVKPQISEFLQQQQARKLENDLAQRLRSGATIQVFLTAPEPPVQRISVDDDPARGSASAPVTVVVFTDFQCPFCAAAHPYIESVTHSYGDKVRLVVRDFPLPQHQLARKAAEAADAANAQGKFFEYANLLFKNQSALDVPSLKKYAAQVGLNQAQFDADLDNGKYAAEVQKDITDGQFYGIDSTPSVFVNGVKLNVVSEAEVKAAIDRALSAGSR